MRSSPSRSEVQQALTVARCGKAPQGFSVRRGRFCGINALATVSSQLTPQVSDLVQPWHCAWQASRGKGVATHPLSAYSPRSEGCGIATWQASLVRGVAGGFLNPCTATPPAVGEEEHR